MQSHGYILTSKGLNFKPFLKINKTNYLSLTIFSAIDLGTSV